MAATYLKSWNRAKKKGWKVRGTKKKQLQEHVELNRLIISNMIVYKKEHLIIKSSKDHQKIQQLGAIYVHEVQSWALRPHCIKTGLIVSWKSLHELRNRAIQKFILHLSHEEDAMCEHDSETMASSLSQSSSRIYWDEVGNCSVVKFEILIGNYGHWNRQTKKERKHPAYF